MGFLDNSSITVDAILTKYGKRKLAAGKSLDIQFFGLSDDGCDYRLWNAGHTGGSDSYGEAIEEMAMLEASTDQSLNMRYKLGPGQIDQIVNPYLILDYTSYTLEGNNAKLYSETIEPATANTAQLENYNFTIMGAENVMFSPGGTNVDKGSASTYLPEGDASQTVTVENTKRLTIWAPPLTATQYAVVHVEGTDTGCSGAIRITLSKNV